MSFLDMELKDEELNNLSAWLQDKRGLPFWYWVKAICQTRHLQASKPMGANPIKDIIDSQRNLEAENAYDTVLNFKKMLDDFLIDKKMRK
jgi:hypothetical protein